MGGLPLQATAVDRCDSALSFTSQCSLAGDNKQLLSLELEFFSTKLNFTEFLHFVNKGLLPVDDIFS